MTSIIGRVRTTLAGLEATPPFVEAEGEEFSSQSRTPQKRRAEPMFLVQCVAREQGGEDGAEDQVCVIESEADANPLSPLF